MAYGLVSAKSNLLLRTYDHGALPLQPVPWQYHTIRYLTYTPSSSTWNPKMMIFQRRYSPFPKSLSASQTAVTRWIMMSYTFDSFLYDNGFSPETAKHEAMYFIPIVSQLDDGFHIPVCHKYGGDVPVFGTTYEIYGRLFNGMLQNRG